MSINRLKTTDYYESTDLALSAFLSIWYSLEGVDRTNPQKALFLFKRNKELDEIIEAYWQGKASVNPQTYFSAIKNLKARLYENR